MEHVRRLVFRVEDISGHIYPILSDGTVLRQSSEGGFEPNGWVLQDAEKGIFIDPAGSLKTFDGSTVEFSALSFLVNPFNTSDWKRGTPETSSISVWSKSLRKKLTKREHRVYSALAFGDSCTFECDEAFAQDTSPIVVSSDGSLQLDKLESYAFGAVLMAERRDDPKYDVLRQSLDPVQSFSFLSIPIEAKTIDWSDPFWAAGRNREKESFRQKDVWTRVSRTSLPAGAKAGS